MDFLQQVFVAPCEGIKLCFSRFLPKNVGEIGQRTPKLEHVKTLLEMKRNHFLHNPQSWNNVFAVVPPQKVFESLQCSFFSNFLRVKVVFRSIMWYFREFQISRGRFHCNSAVDSFLKVLKFLLNRVGFSYLIAKVNVRGSSV